MKVNGMHSLPHGRVFTQWMQQGSGVPVGVGVVCDAGQSSAAGSPAARRRMFTPSVTVMLPLSSTSQIATEHVLASRAAARRPFTPSVTVTIPLPSASPHICA